MKLLTLGAGIGLLASVTTAHMEMKWPPPFRSKYNPYANGDVDYSMTSPLNTETADNAGGFPCKGYLHYVGTPEGKTVATLQTGQKYNMTITGGANHNGGSCQASVSHDMGKSWKVIQSYIGECPAQGESNLDFTLPSDTPSGDMLLAWTWLNNEGNREMYMNCAMITATGGKKRGASDSSLASRPDMFVANLASINKCSTEEGYDVDFPHPGPDTLDKSKKKKAPKGDHCEYSQGGGSSDAGSLASTTAASNPTGAPGGGTQYDSSPGDSGSDDGGDDGGSDGPQISATTPGGVFMTTGFEESTFRTFTTPTPTLPGVTIITTPVGTPASTGTTQTLPGVTTPVGPPISTDSTPAAQPTDGSAGGYSPGVPCKQEGVWNCVEGKQFQRCASGAWSPLQPMSAGLKCNPGISDNLIFA